MFPCSRFSTIKEVLYHQNGITGTHILPYAGNATWFRNRKMRTEIDQFRVKLLSSGEIMMRKAEIRDDA